MSDIKYLMPVASGHRRLSLPPVTRDLLLSPDHTAAVLSSDQRRGSVCVNLPQSNTLHRDASTDDGQVKLATRDNDAELSSQIDTCRDELSLLLAAVSQLEVCLSYYCTRLSFCSQPPSSV